MDPRHAIVLDRSIGPDRLGTYLAESDGDADLARRLHVWDRDLAVALLGDIAIVEVALRNALNERLMATYGGPTLYLLATGPWNSLSPPTSGQGVIAASGSPTGLTRRESRPVVTRSGPTG